MLRIDEVDVVPHLPTPVHPLHGVALGVGFDGGVFPHQNRLGGNLFGTLHFGQIGTEQQTPRLQLSPSRLQLAQIGIEGQQRAEDRVREGERKREREKERNIISYLKYFSCRVHSSIRSMWRSARAIELT